MAEPKRPPLQEQLQPEPPRSQAAILENPLAYKSEQDILADVQQFCKENEGLSGHVGLFKRAALLAANPHALEGRDDISEEDKVILREEVTHKWRRPWLLYYISVMSSLAAVVQGMDESVVNGAQVFYYAAFGINKDSDSIIQGLVNSAPYLCCFALACWLTAPMNKYFGRRGTIWISCLVAGIAWLPFHRNESSSYVYTVHDYKSWDRARSLIMIPTFEYIPVT